MSISPAAARRRRRLALLSVVVVLVLLVLLVALAIHAVRGHFTTKDYSGDGYGSTTVHVVSGDTVTDIGQTLVADGVVASVKAFNEAAAANSRATDVGPGYYRLHRHMSAADAVALLLRPSSLIQSAVTIPEGFTAKAIVQRVAAETTITASALNAALASPAAIKLPAVAGGKPEGFLFPATYDFAPGSTADQVLGAMTARFDQEASALDLARNARKVGLTAHDVVTLASIVQREGRLTSDYPRIAEVFLNRLKARMPLGSNATLAYVLGRAPTSYADLHLKSPYNTEFSPGLPPTPINSPGELALQAVLHPAHGDDLYFVTIDKAGHTGFASTYSGFQALEAEATRNGVH